MSPQPVSRTPAGAMPRFTTLDDWLVWQEGLHGREIELGLERCRAVAERLDLCRPRYAVVSIAGTNGKGSSVAMLDAILSAAGYKVGRYTSPHLVRYNERIRIAGEAASDAAICAAFNRIDQARGEISLTYFEFGTLAALDLFEREQVDVALLEVGLGGRLDAVNILDADVALVATIDIDHVEWLGSDRESIGREKAGIFRAGRPAVCSDPLPPASLVEHAAELNTDLRLGGRDYGYDADGRGWNWWSGKQRYENLPRPNLRGEFQLQNAAGALMVLEMLAPRCPVERTAIDHGLCHLSLPGRYQEFPGPVTWILDVAHNPQSARVLAETLKVQPIAGRTHFLAGMLRDKDIGGVFSIVKDLADSWHLASLPPRRGASAAQLHEQLEALHVTAPVFLHESVEAACAAMKKQARSGDRVLVFGSFLTVAGAARVLDNSD